ncbi:unnamed protein product [Paramecium primaurelia]|uniref:Uncharacterized protein n=1 Tax=Paramecium primaurelia TaxID=5886 RepID=A0A8S1P514_PARPR|nr:unnamed protein product [Paramecium primaurelia]
MSNIKFIYLKKIHKVPSNVTHYYDLIETIKNTYKQLNQIHLFAIINPQNPEAVTEINSDVTFLQLKLFYHQQGWPSIKLLVTETQNYQEILKDSWNLLNQSIIITDKKNQDASTFIQPNQQDQCQQFKPLLGNIGTQAKVQQIDNAQNTNKIDYKNNEQLKQLIDEIIDQKLTELGLLIKEEKIDPNNYKFQLTTKIPKFTSIKNKNLNLCLQLKNTGNKNWINPYITNKGLNVTQRFKDLVPGSIASIKISIPYIAQHFINNDQFCYIFEIYVENENGQLCLVNGQIPVRVKAPSKNPLTPQEEKIQKLLELFPQKGEQYIIKYVEQKGKHKTAEQLIEEILLQNI